MKKRNLIILILILCIISIISFYIGRNNVETIYTYALFSSNSIDTDSSLNNTKFIFTFDNNDICIDCRIMFDFSNEEVAYTQYTALLSKEENNRKNENISNLNINSTKVTYNTNEYNGQNKTEIMNLRIVGENGDYIEF